MTRNYPEAIQRTSDWEEILADEPDIMWGIISDVIKIVQSQNVDVRVGRRPEPEMMSVDGVWSVLFPDRFTTKPFPAAFADLVGTERGSARQMSGKVPCTEKTVSSLLSGKQAPSPTMMEAISRVTGVTPAYFVEWRAWRISGLVTDALLADPARSATVAKKIIRGGYQ